MFHNIFIFKFNAPINQVYSSILAKRCLVVEFLFYLTFYASHTILRFNDFQ